jgi:hypothetical protein
MPEKRPYRTLWSEYDHGVFDALTAALDALDGHSFNDTAHDRVRRLRACSECGHAPEKHHAEGWCQDHVVIPGKAPWPCPCAEYEPPMLPARKAVDNDGSQA